MKGKRFISIRRTAVAAFLCLLLLIPVFVLGSSAEESGWLFLAGKYQGNVIFKGNSPDMTGFTFEADKNGGINVHTATKDEATGSYGVSVLTNTNKTVLDNLSVTIMPGETYTSEKEAGCSDRLSIMFSTSPITKIAESGSESGLKDSSLVSAHGIRYLMPDTGDSVLVSVSNTYDKHASHVDSDVTVVTYDGVYKEGTAKIPGYKWVFSGKMVDEIVTKEFPEIDFSKGLVFEFVPDTTLGYKISINGKEYYKGTACSSTPADKGVVDIGLGQFVDEEGYLTIAGCANNSCTLDYTVETINGINAAQWKGESASSHTHNFKKTSKASTCTESGYDYYECSCGQHFVYNYMEASGHKWAYNTDRTFRDGFAYTDVYYTDNMSSSGNHKYAFVTFPTCTENGLNHKICVTCGAVEDEVLPALNHQANYTVIQQTQNGKNKIFHSNRWSDWYITTPATATTPGVKERKCTICGATETMEYTKYDDTEEVDSKWYVSGETTISRSNGLLTGNVIDTVINTDGKRTYTTLNKDGSITILDAASKTGIFDKSTVNNNITKITSNSASKLNNFEATVQAVKVNGLYPDSINFCWTTEPESYRYAGQFSAGSYSKKFNSSIEDSRFGYAYDKYIPGVEYTFFVTLMDGFKLWGQQVYGTPEDGVYDLVLYGSVCRGDFWTAKTTTTAMNLDTCDYETLALKASEPINIKVGYCYDEDEDNPDCLSIVLNNKIIYTEGIGGSQSYDKAYYFSACAFSSEICKDAMKTKLTPASFTLIDVCGEKPMEFDGWDDPNGCQHEWGDWEWEQVTVTRIVNNKEKKVRINNEPTCDNNGYKISTCELCGCTKKQIVSRKGHTWSEWDTVFEPTCASEGLKKRTCTVWALDGNGVEQPCGEVEYALIECGHVWNDWDEVTPVSCTQDGLKRRTCSECTEFEEEVITAPGHQWGEWDTVTPVSCTANGLKRRTCTKCTDGVEEEVIEFKGHVWGEWKVVTPATEESKGLKKRSCTKCTAEETEDIPKLEPEYNNPFTDVPADSWFTKAALWCNGKGYITGTTKTTFSPDVALSRAMFVVILAKVEGVDLNSVTYKGKFTDVPDGQWYTKAVQWAVDCGITSGISTDKFGPNVTVSREQLATFFLAYAKYKKYDTASTVSLEKYKDAKDISSWAVNAVKWAVAEGLISGTSATTVSPKESATRAQAAVIFKSFVENYVAKQK